MIKSTLIFFFLALGASIVHAQANQLEELNVGSTREQAKFSPERSDDELVKSVDEEADLICEKNMCTFVSKKSENKGWSVSFTFGTNNAAGNGTNIYLNGQQTDDRNSVSFTVRYNNIECESTMNLGRTDTINSIARGRGERESGTYRMKQLTSDMKFERLVKLEYAKILSNGNCGTN